MTVTRLGDVITIFPARQSLVDAVAALRAVPKPSAVDKHESTEMPERVRP